jgi:sugar phosphate isomerase/epimerase
VLDDAFTLLGHEIVLAHAKDLDGEAGHVAAGKGKLDYDRYLALLRSVEYNGPLILHSLDETEVDGSVAVLRTKLAKVPQ